MGHTLAEITAERAAWGDPVTVRRHDANAITDRHPLARVTYANGKWEWIRHENIRTCMHDGCDRVLNQYADNQECSEHTAPVVKPRKKTIFEPCETHAAKYAGETRKRQAECMVEGGFPGDCAPVPCQMKPGTDLYGADFVSAHPVYRVGLQ